MKLRKDITAAEVAELHDRLDRQLDRVGLETQPKVALRILELVGRQDAQLKDYHDAIRTDAAITGRLLRLANSAYFAQRSPVTKLERALVLLGIERVKAVSLGFYLSRAAAPGGIRAITREVWSQSLFRACLASCLVKNRHRALASEAFVVGLMLDSGIPLAARLLGEQFERLHAMVGGPHPGGVSPPRLFLAENNSLEFTHVDVAVVLCRRWRLPPLLAKPIAWHHVQPPAEHLSTPDPVSVLQRAAYYAGAVTLDSFGHARDAIPLSNLGSRIMDMSPDELAAAVRGAAEEHGAIGTMFSDVAGEVPNLDSIADAVALQMIGLLDHQIATSVRTEGRQAPARLSVAGFQIEMQPRDAGRVEVFIESNAGERLVTYTADPVRDTTATLQRALGLEEATEDEMTSMVAELRALAA